MADGAFWAWGPTAWQRIEDRELRMAVHHFDNVAISQSNKGLNVSSGKVDGVLRETGTILGKPNFFSNPAVALNALNTVITIDAEGRIETRNHDPDDRFRFTIPAEFQIDTDMIPPPRSMLHTLLEGAFRDDPDAGEKMWLIAEILGAAAFGMATRMPQPKAFVFLGETASNGKSTIASLLSCLLPDGSVSAIKPGDFSDPARIVNLAGKAANVADEISGAVAREMFKAAVTGNVLEGRDLYRSAMTFVPRAIHVFTTNKLPTFNGGLDRGLQRRLVVLTFTRPIPKSEVIADIADRIKRDEMDLLLGFAIAGALRLVRNKAYTEPLSSADALRGWLMMDPIHDWFDATVKSCEDEPRSGWPSVKALFIDFKAWAIDQGHSERNLPTINNFSQRLRSMPGVTIVRRSAGTTAKGITCAFASGL
jgi:phage/plasmid-associated DNA primase